VVQVACGFQHSLALTDKGEVFTWGEGKYGALGHGDFSDKQIPEKVPGLSNIKKIKCGSEFSMALDDKGQIFVFGQNSYGQLGVQGRTYKVNAPQKLALSRALGKV
jgi:alpha-tubulin suppressor-like RCC1 family protein